MLEYSGIIENSDKQAGPCPSGLGGFVWLVFWSGENRSPAHFRFQGVEMRVPEAREAHFIACRRIDNPVHQEQSLNSVSGSLSQKQNQGRILSPLKDAGGKVKTGALL